MNVNELYQQMDKVRQAANGLSTLALYSLEISLRVDKQGRICKSLKPVDGGQATVSYDNLWADVSEGMFEQALGEIDTMRRAMTARLWHASARIEHDIIEQNFGGTISFWRNGSSWLQPLVHDESWESDGNLFFADGFDAGNGEIKAFACRRHLWQMPEEYQSGFITDFWPDFSVNAMERVIFSGGPPPAIDSEIAGAGPEWPGVQGGVWT